MQDRLGQGNGVLRACKRFDHAGDTANFAGAQGRVGVTVNFLPGIISGGVSAQKPFECDKTGCGLAISLEPQVKQDSGGTMYFSPLTPLATFAFSGGAGVIPALAQATVRSGNMHIEGEMVVEVVKTTETTTSVPVPGGPSYPPTPKPEPPAQSSCPLSQAEIAAIDYTTVLDKVDRYPSCRQPILTYSCSKLSGVDVAALGFDDALAARGRSRCFSGGELRANHLIYV